MEFHDKVLKCAECNQEFVFTAGEQELFVSSGQTGILPGKLLHKPECGFLWDGTW